MNFFWRFIACALLVVWTPQLASGQDTTFESDYEKSRQASVTISEAFKKCDSANATLISFDDLFDPAIEPFQANPKYLHTCVKVKAIASWRHIFKDNLSEYRTEQSGIVQAHTLVRQHVGLRNHNLMTKIGLMNTRLNAEIVGILGTCGFTMGGYCHYYEGPYITAVSITGDPIISKMRYVGAKAAQEFGNLESLEQKVVEEIELEDVFENWIHHVAKADEDSFNWLASEFPYYESDIITFEEFQTAKKKERLGEQHWERWHTLFDKTAPFRQLENHWELERRYFQRVTRLKLPPDMGKPYYGQMNYEYFACICLEESCDNRWPISTTDVPMATSNAYPYICLSATDRSKRHENQGSFFVEPRNPNKKIQPLSVSPPYGSDDTIVSELTWPKEK